MGLSIGVQHRHPKPAGKRRSFASPQAVDESYGKKFPRYSIARQIAAWGHCRNAPVLMSWHEQRRHNFRRHLRHHRILRSSHPGTCDARKSDLGALRLAMGIRWIIDCHSPGGMRCGCWTPMGLSASWRKKSGGRWRNMADRRKPRRSSASPHKASKHPATSGTIQFWKAPKQRPRGTAHIRVKR